MRSDQIESLAVEIEAEELEREDGETMSAADIGLVLEILWERGVDLDGAHADGGRDEREEAEEEIQGQVAS